MAQSANSAGSVALRGALVLVLLVGALVSNAEATRNSGLGAASVAAAPVAGVHPAYMMDCMMECATQVTRCVISCLNKPLLEGPHCAMACATANVNCAVHCGRAPALGPTPQA